MKRSFLQNSARRTAFVLAMLLLLGGTPVQAAENTTACKNQQPSMESKVCPLLLPPGNSVTLSAEYLEMRLGLPAGEIAAITITSLPRAAFALQMENVSTRPMGERREPTALC